MKIILAVLCTAAIITVILVTVAAVALLHVEAEMKYDPDRKDKKK